MYTTQAQNEEHEESNVSMDQGDETNGAEPEDLNGTDELEEEEDDDDQQGKTFILISHCTILLTFTLIIVQSR